MFKKAIETKEVDKWADYKKLRDELTSDVRKAKTAYLKRKFDDVKTTSAIGIYCLEKPIPKLENQSVR